MLPSKPMHKGIYTIAMQDYLNKTFIKLVMNPVIVVEICETH